MTDVATRTPAQELVAQVRAPAFQQQVAMALPEGMKPERFVRVMATALLENPELAGKADANTILSAGIKAAQDGLLPDGREAAFVMFKGKCQYLPMVGGLRKIAAQYGWVLTAAVVYEHDVFEFRLGLDEGLIHRPPRPGSDRGPSIGAYAVARHRGDGTRVFEFLEAAEIEKVRATSRNADKGPWVEWPDRMWEKTAARRLFKKLPLAEADRERVERLLNVGELAPGESTSLLYGPMAVPSGGEQAALPSSSEPAPPESSEPASQGIETPPDSAVAAEPQAGSDRSSADADSEESAAFAGEEPPLASPADDPADVVFDAGRLKGLTIGQVAKDEPDYIVWAVKSWKPGPVKEALKAFVAAK